MANRKTRTDFFKQYLELSKEEQELLQMAALTYEPLTRTDILKCGKACGILLGKHQVMQSLVQNVAENNKVCFLFGK
jgi:hypothetical protein